MVGAEGFEPPTLCSQSRCATRLRYAPTTSFDCIANRPAFSLASLPEKPCQQPHHQCQRNGKDDGHCQPQQHQKDPVTPGVTPWLAQVAHQQLIVPAVRFPRTRYRRCLPNRGIVPMSDADSQVLTIMAQQRDVRYATNPRGQRDDKRKQPKASTSPSPGTSPMIPSIPKRMFVPGTRNRLIQQDLELAAMSHHETAMRPYSSDLAL